MRGRQSVQRTGCQEGPTIHFDPTPGRNPRPLASFVSRLGPPFCGRVQSLCDGCRGAFKISAPSISAPDKDDAVPRVRKADGGKREGGSRVQRTGCHEGPTILFDRPPAGTLAPSPPSFPGWAGRSMAVESRCSLPTCRLLRMKPKTRDSSGSPCGSSICCSEPFLSSPRPS
jgi:hypothetical protein